MRFGDVTKIGCRRISDPQTRGTSPCTSVMGSRPWSDSGGQFAADGADAAKAALRPCGYVTGSTAAFVCLALAFARATPDARSGRAYLQGRRLRDNRRESAGTRPLHAGQGVTSGTGRLGARRRVAMRYEGAASHGPRREWICDGEPGLSTVRRRKVSGGGPRYQGSDPFPSRKAPEYGYRADRIAIAGSSSGGHLAALVGVSNRHKDLEGAVGDHANQSSNVAAIIDYYGASNLMTILAQSTPSD